MGGGPDDRAPPASGRKITVGLGGACPPAPHEALAPMKGERRPDLRNSRPKTDGQGIFPRGGGSVSLPAASGREE